jgi:hypothetical protein
MESSRGGLTTALGRIGPRSGCKGPCGGEAKYVQALRLTAAILRMLRIGIVSSADLPP